MNMAEPEVQDGGWKRRGSGDRHNSSDGPDGRHEAHVGPDQEDRGGFSSGDVREAQGRGVLGLQGDGEGRGEGGTDQGLRPDSGADHHGPTNGGGLTEEETGNWARDFLQASKGEGEIADPGPNITNPYADEARQPQSYPAYDDGDDEESSGDITLLNVDRVKRRDTPSILSSGDVIVDGDMEVSGELRVGGNLIVGGAVAAANAPYLPNRTDPPHLNAQRQPGFRPVDVLQGLDIGDVRLPGDAVPPPSGVQFYRGLAHDGSEDAMRPPPMEYLREVHHDINPGEPVTTKYRSVAIMENYSTGINLSSYVGMTASAATFAKIKLDLEDKMMQELATAMPANSFIRSVNVGMEPPMVTSISGATNATSSSTWGDWNNAYTITIDVTLSADNPATFVTDSTGTGTVVTVATWGAWNTNYRALRAVVHPDAPQLTPEQQIEAEARAATRREQQQVQQLEAQQQRVAARAQLAQANDRAEELLHSMLSAEQIDMLTRDGKFMVEVNGGRVYEIRRGRAHNVYLLGANGKPIQELCAHVGPYIPNADNMLAQMLALQTGEDGFRKIANIWQLVNGQKDYRAISSSGVESPASLVERAA